MHEREFSYDPGATQMMTPEEHRRAALSETEQVISPLAETMPVKVLKETRPDKSVVKSESPSKEREAITVEIKIGEVMTDERGDQYVVLKKIGEGGMGGVFQVRDERTGLIRAIKFMNSSERAVPMMVKRFEREMSVLGQLNDPFILVGLDVLRFQEEGESIVGFMTDFVEGPDLEQEIMKEGSMKPERLVTIAGQMLLALETLRKGGIVHRDLKPANIFLQEMPNKEQLVRIGDFGIVGFEFESDRSTPSKEDSFESMRGEQLTRVGYTVGTPEFMSPEATQGGPVDHRSDLYSLGVVMYEMATGSLPFQDENVSEVLLSHMTKRPASFVEQGKKDLPPWLETIIQKLLQKRPDQRYGSAAEVFQELKKGVAKDYPKLLNEIPFIWNIKPPFYDTSIPVDA